MDNISTLQIFSDLLEKHTGQTLTASRYWRIESALKSIMRLNSIPDIETLAAIICGGEEEELALACVDLLINNETCFFRDQANFALLTGPLLDLMRAQRQHSKTLRIWSAACSTGQEAYSIAMSIAENREKWRGWTIEICATDISQAALARAREGRYSQFEIQRGLPAMLMLKYFDQIGEYWTVKDSLRNNINFHSHNMLSPSAHFGQFDVILCRNMLMYLSDDRRERVVNAIADSLAKDGKVMLGAAETVIGLTERMRSSREFRGFFESSEIETASPNASMPNFARRA